MFVLKSILRACSRRYSGAEISRSHVFSQFWKLVRSHETGITRVKGQLLSCDRSANLGGAGTTSTVMRMTSFAHGKPRWRTRCHMLHNMQEEIHLIYIERTKRNYSRKLIKLLVEHHLVRLTIFPSIVMTRSNSPGVITHSIMWRTNLSGGWDISGVRDISPPCEQARIISSLLKFTSS